MSRRLSFFIHSLSAGGAERATTNLANYWVGRGWPIAIITVAPRAEDFYEIDPRIRRIALDSATPSNGVASAVRNNARRIAALRRALKDTDPEFAVAMMTSANVLLAFASVGLDCTTVGCERIHPPKLPLGYSWEFLRRTTYRQLDAIAALTEQSAGWLRANTSARRVATIPNAVLWPLPDQEPALDPTTVCSADRKLIVSVGRLTPQKQFRHLVEAFAEICASQPNWDLVILGEGPERVSLEALVRNLGCSRRIFMPGEVGNIGDWYARADVFALSSAYEGFPNVLAEAMAYGVAVVSYDCETGPRELVSHERTGLLVSANNSKRLRDELLRLLKDETLRRALAEQAKEVRERFSLARVARSWEDFLVDLQRTNQL